MLFVTRTLYTLEFLQFDIISCASPSDSVYDKTNGIPHRIPPPDEQGSDGSEMGDVDMLHDIDREKDVFRTKVSGYITWYR